VNPKTNFSRFVNKQMCDKHIIYVNENTKKAAKAAWKSYS